MDNGQDFVNHRCPFYPCHPLDAGDWHSCIFCYCPLYLLHCEGSYVLLPSGMKDCSRCTLPHEAGGWEVVLGEIGKQLFSPRKENARG